MIQKIKGFRNRYHDTYVAMPTWRKVSMLLIPAAFWFWWCSVWTEHLLKNDLMHARYPFWMELCALLIGVLFVVKITLTISTVILDEYIF